MHKAFFWGILVIAVAQLSAVDLGQLSEESVTKEILEKVVEETFNARAQMVCKIDQMKADLTRSRDLYSKLGKSPISYDRYSLELSIACMCQNIKGAEVLKRAGAEGESLSFAKSLVVDNLFTRRAELVNRVNDGVTEVNQHENSVEKYCKSNTFCGALISKSLKGLASLSDEQVLETILWNDTVRMFMQSQYKKAHGKIPTQQEISKYSREKQ